MALERLPGNLGGWECALDPEYILRMEGISFANGLAWSGSRRGDTREPEVSFTKLGKVGKEQVLCWAVLSHRLLVLSVSVGGRGQCWRCYQLACFRAQGLVRSPGE